jgi:hypothetical protein
MYKREHEGEEQFVKYSPFDLRSKMDGLTAVLHMLVKYECCVCCCVLCLDQHIL